MQPFSHLHATAAPLNLINIDTDMIIPKQFLKTIKRTGLGQFLFDEMRHTQTGEEIPEFILNQPNYRNSKILVAGDNFGCGSSREHAPWALLDFGIRCVIAPSFADIFHNNCFKNGILPIRLPQSAVDELMSHAANPENCDLIIDLETQTVTIPNTTKKFTFDINPFQKKCLLEGLDDIGLTLAKKKSIDNFEAQNEQKLPWLWN